MIKFAKPLRYKKCIINKLSTLLIFPNQVSTNLFPPFIELSFYDPIIDYTEQFSAVVLLYDAFTIA